MGQFSMEKPALKGQFSVEINNDDLVPLGEGAADLRKTGF